MKFKSKKSGQDESVRYAHKRNDKRTNEITG